MRTIDLTVPDSQGDNEHFASLSWIESTEEPVPALGRVYPAGFRGLPHSHTKTQLWCSRGGVVVVSTAGGRWMIPAGDGTSAWLQL